MMDTCEWELDVSFDGSICYDTSCGEAQFFTEGDIAGNGYVFCPYCGSKIFAEEDGGLDGDGQDV